MHGIAGYQSSKKSIYFLNNDFCRGFGMGKKLIKHSLKVNLQIFVQIVALEKVCNEQKIETSRRIFPTAMENHLPDSNMLLRARIGRR